MDKTHDKNLAGITSILAKASAMEEEWAF